MQCNATSERSSDKTPSHRTEIHTWLIANKLSLNVIKTKYMIVASQYRIKHLEHQFNIQVDHKSLVRDVTYKYLGVEIELPGW